MTVEPGLSYDLVPYPSMSHYSTHPDGLATLARLGGMHPAPVESCRVLELGCADGGNLLPMAYALPGSRFYGIDLSETHIAAGKLKLKSMSLSNITLQRLDILDLDAGLGPFDYIIAHGVYSWVPVQVREKILELCSSLLAPQGVAFISYNAYPGWHNINMVRDLMRFHVREISDPVERVNEARAVLRFYADANPGGKNAYSSFLKFYSDYIDGNLEGQTPKYDAALLHDELEELNQPFYFYQFIEQAQAHGLQYLNDLRQIEVVDSNPQVVEALRKRSKNVVELEQSLDFLQNRTFRRTLLCHQEVALNRKIKPAQARDFYFASRAVPESEQPQLNTVSVEKFKGQDGAILTIDHPVSKAAMLCLADAWPQSLSLDQLLFAACARLACEQAQSDSVDAQVLGMNLFKAFGYSSSLVELHVHALPLAAQAPEKPLVSRVACLQAREGREVTNFRHERVTIDDLDRVLLSYLDGTHDREELLALMIGGPLAEGLLKVEKDGKPVDAALQPSLLAEELDQRLKWLAQTALLVDPAKLGGDEHGTR
jgi:methyltransferase-like protein